MFEARPTGGGAARAARWSLLAGAALALDQGSKWLVAQDLPLYAVRPVTGFFNLVHVENPGAAFSFLAGQPGWQRWFFTLLGLAAAALILRVLATHRRGALFSAGLALILGGALGNVVDRVLRGHVTDFLDFYVSIGQSSWHWWAFNIADSAIFLGAVALLLDEWRPRRAR